MPTTTTAFGPESVHLAALDVVMAQIEAVEHRIRAAETERLRLFAEAFDIAAAETEHRIASTPSGTAGELAYRAMRAELATALNQSEHTIERHLEHAHTLTRSYPRVFEAYSSGRISAQHATVITNVGVMIGSHDDPDTVSRRAGYEQAVLKIAVAETPGRVRPIAARLAEQYATVSLEDRHVEARRRRRVWVQAGEDGMADLMAHLPAAEAYGIWDRLTRMGRAVAQAEPAHGAHENTGVGAGGASEVSDVSARRSRDEIRADVFADLLLAGSPEDSDGLAAVRAQVQVLIPDHTLALPSSRLGNNGPAAPCPDSLIDAAGMRPAATETVPGLAEQPAPAPPFPAPPLLAGYGPIDTETARLLAAYATHWERIRTTPDTGVVLSVDRYRPAEEMRRHLGARDQHCRFPGCRVPLSRCDIDHTIDAARGGPTATDNLAHLCRGHHTLKHHSGWRVRQHRDGELAWTSPTGRVHHDRPPSRVMFTPAGPAPPPNPPPAPF